MKVFTVFLLVSNVRKNREIRIIKEGFSWGAFLFTIFWVLNKKIWPLALGVLGVLIPLIILGKALSFGWLEFFVFFFWLSFVFGHVAHDFERWWIMRRGFQFCDLIQGTTFEVALCRFFEREEFLHFCYDHVEVQ